MLDELVARVPPTKRIKLRGGPWSGLGQFLPQSSPIQKVFRMLFKIFYAAELIFYELNWILKSIWKV